MRARLPRVLGPAPHGGHWLRHAWAYKYIERDSRISVHADNAAVTVNCWLTRDRHNLGAETEGAGGGMTIHDAVLPLNVSNWVVDVDEWLAAQPSHRVWNVAHRRNRCVLFYSAFVHTTDRVRFEPTFEGHRVNLSWLFGERPVGVPEAQAHQAWRVAGGAKAAGRPFFTR